jgi:hypothetical protein
MASSGMLGRVASVRTDVSEGLSASFIGVTRNAKKYQVVLVLLVFLRSVRRLLVTATPLLSPDRFCSFLIV